MLGMGHLHLRVFNNYISAAWIELPNIYKEVLWVLIALFELSVNICSLRVTHAATSLPGFGDEVGHK